MASGNTSRSPIVDVREIVKANDPRSNNKSGWAHVFIFTHYVFRSGGLYPLTSREMAAERTEPKPPSPVMSEFVGRELWVESQLLMKQNNGFQIKEEKFTSVKHIFQAKDPGVLG